MNSWPTLWVLQSWARFRYHKKKLEHFSSSFSNLHVSVMKHGNESDLLAVAQEGWLNKMIGYAIRELEENGL